MEHSNLGQWMARLRDPSTRPDIDPAAIDDGAVDSAVSFSAEHTRRYLATGGADDGWDGPGPILILYTRGRRSGEWRRNPLLYVDHEGRRHVIASLGGAPKHPQWYRNLVDDPHVRLQVGAERYEATARTLTSEERAAFWPQLVERYPMFRDYQAATDREIPVVELVPGAPS